MRGEVHTNNVESFWSLLKRGVIGTYHNVSKKYLPLYLAEFQFRHNNRKNADIFGAVRKQDAEVVRHWRSLSLLHHAPRKPKQLNLNSQGRVVIRTRGTYKCAES